MIRFQAVHMTWGIDYMSAELSPDFAQFQICRVREKTDTPNQPLVIYFALAFLPLEPNNTSSLIPSSAFSQRSSVGVWRCVLRSVFETKKNRAVLWLAWLSWVSCFLCRSPAILLRGLGLTVTHTLELKDHRTSPGEFKDPPRHHQAPQLHPSPQPSPLLQLHPCHNSTDHQPTTTPHTTEQPTYRHPTAPSPLNWKVSQSVRQSRVRHVIPMNWTESAIWSVYSVWCTLSLTQCIVLSYWVCSVNRWLDGFIVRSWGHLLRTSSSSVLFGYRASQKFGLGFVYIFY